MPFIHTDINFSSNSSVSISVSSLISSNLFSILRPLTHYHLTVSSLRVCPSGVHCHDLLPGSLTRINMMSHVSYFSATPLQTQRSMPTP